MPGYGISDSAEGILPWSWAAERLSQAHNYFVATARPDGRPHVMPVWGLWLDDAFYFSTGASSRKARNLAANPRCVGMSLCWSDSNEIGIRIIKYPAN